MSDLTDKQERFTYLVGHLIARISACGYGVAFGEAWRPDATAMLYGLGTAGRNELAAYLKRGGGKYDEIAAALPLMGNGIKTSLHRDRLAVDIILRKNGVTCWDMQDYEPFGVYWETQAPDCAWGGRFGDPAHFSLAYGGRR